MNTADQIDDEQANLWNGPAGRAWTEAQDILDEMFRPFEAPLLEAVPAQSAARVLDVGCGTGGLTVALARRLGKQGRAVGVDISAPMIAAAQARATQDGAAASFICANAQDHEFEPASFDAIISRLGVMFFADPVAAFTTLKRAAADGAELRFMAWRNASENPFMTTAERAAAPLLPNLPARRMEGAGQFAFADPRRITSILEASDWSGIDIQPIDIGCSLPARELVRYVSWLGPVGVILQEADDRTRAQVVAAVRPAFDAYLQGDDVRFTAACWLVRARANVAGGE